LHLTRKELMRYWIFKCNPKKYRIDDRLKDPEKRITWKVTRYKDQIQKGDVAFIWRSGPKRGICAVMRIDCNAIEIKDIETEVKYYIDADSGEIPRVKGTLTHRFQCIPAQDLKNIQGLKHLSVFSGYQQTTNFKVTNEQGNTLMKLIEKR